MIDDHINFIYTLSDPRDNSVRYVGVTCDPEARFTEHLYQRNGGEKSIWISELKDLGLKPVCTIIEKHDYTKSKESKGKREKFWIQHYANRGAKLFNRVNLNPDLPIVFDLKEQSPTTEDEIASLRAENMRLKSALKEITQILKQVCK